MKSFASDNYSTVCKEVLEAINNANHNHEPSYGSDFYTEQAIALLKDTFGDNITVYFVLNGTAANTLALEAMMRSHQAILCADSAHIIVHETGAIFKTIGCSVIPIPNNQGKITPSLIEETYQKISLIGKHHNKPKVVSISQSTEYGTVYTQKELLAISAVCKKYQLLFHMDGCRLSNAAVSLQASLKNLTADVGVDVLSFGGTKNGLMFGEVVIFFRSDLAEEFEYIHKQGLQLLSKMRYLSVQFIPYLKDNIWHRNAEHANKMCQRIAQGLLNRSDIKLVYPIQTNQIFAVFPQSIIANTRYIFPYYVWDEKNNIIRLVTSFDTTIEDVDEFLRLAFI